MLKVDESIQALEAKLKQLALRVLAWGAAVSAFLVLVAAPTTPLPELENVRWDR